MNNPKQQIWPKVTVVIVNWNSEQFLDRCLSALMIQTVTTHDIILLDNASSDSSLDIVQRFPSVRVLAQKENVGFARGNNLVAKAVSPDVEWLALLNPDAFPTKRWLEELLLAARNYPDFEIFGSKLLKASAPNILDGTGDIYHVSGLAWRADHGCILPDLEGEAREIFSPCAAAALYRRDAFKEVGGFDEDFFCYMEDVDLGFRLKLRGYKCLYVPESVVYHIGSATTGHNHSDFAVYHGHRNLVWTYVKNMPDILFWLLLPFHMLLNAATCIYFLFRGQGRVIMKAKWDAIKGLPRMWDKRRQIQGRRCISIKKVWQMLDKSIYRGRPQNDAHKDYP